MKSKPQLKGRGTSKDKQKQFAPNVNKKKPWALVPGPAKEDPAWDEDIDDDLAFNSDDERMYGHFFDTGSNEKSTTSASKGKDGEKKHEIKSKAYKMLEKKDDDVEFDLSEAFDRLDAVAPKNDAEEQDSAVKGLSGVGLDAIKSGKKKKRSRDASQGAPNIARIDEEKGGRVTATNTEDLLLQQSESLLPSAQARRAGGDVVRGSKNARNDASPLVVSGSMGSRVDTAKSMRAVQALVAQMPDDGRTAKRLDAALSNTKTLITEELDDYKRERLDREATRQTVEKNLKKYDRFLKEEKNAKVSVFPLPGNEAQPVARSLGGLTAAAIVRQEASASTGGEGALVVPTSSSTAGGNLAMNMNKILEASGLKRSAAEENGYVDFRSGGRGADDDVDEDELARVADSGYRAKLKAMLSYENARRARFKKIKSKTYRRILRKEEERERERREQARELLDPEGTRARRQAKMERDRALERATQKHKNTSKWVKHVKGLPGFKGAGVSNAMEETREAIQEQHRRHELLMQKMEEDAGEAWAGYADEENASRAESEEEDRVVDSLLEEAAKTNGGERDAKTVSSMFWNTGSKKSVAMSNDKLTPFEKAREELNEMRFMKNANERREKEMKELVEGLREDIERHQLGLPLAHMKDDVAGARKNKGPAAGRVRFTAAEGTASQLCHAEDEAEVLQTMASESRENDDGKLDIEEIIEGSKKDTASTANKPTKVKPKRKTGVVLPPVAGITQISSDASNSGVEMTENDTREGKENVDMGDFVGFRKGVTAPAENKASRTAAAQKTSAVAASVMKDESENSKAELVPNKVGPSASGEVLGKSESVSASKSTVHSKRISFDTETSGSTNVDSLSTEYLAARAFAGDDIDEDFQKEKEQQVDKIMRPADRNATLPGWGEWGGESEGLNRRHRVRVAEIELKRKLEKTALMGARADAHLDHVIVNHEIDLVADKYTLHMVPRPFSDEKQYENAMRQPKGPEWTTPLSFTEGTKPRVITKQGAIIDPLDLSRARSKAKTTRRKVQKKAD